MTKFAVHKRHQKRLPLNTTCLSGCALLQVNTTPEGSSQPQKAAAKAASGSLTPAVGQDNSVMDVLENTLWNRQLGVMSEEIVAALVCQIFEGELYT